MSIVIDAEQFKELIKTLGSEPSLSLASGMFWVALGSLLAGGAAFVLALYERNRAKAGADAELILKSFEEYEKLFDSLIVIRDLGKKHEAAIAEIKNKKNYCQSNFKIIDRHGQINRSEWQQARAAKIYFKSRFELVGKGFFSDKALASTMDHAGVNLVRNQLCGLDVLMFYQARKSDYEDKKHPDKYLSETYDGDLEWYFKISNFMSRHNTTFGWRDEKRLIKPERPPSRT